MIGEDAKKSLIPLAEINEILFFKDFPTEAISCK